MGQVGNETPGGFRFSIKAPKAITHENKLQAVEGPRKEFFEQIEPVKKKTGPILFQLPPSLTFDLEIAERFFTLLREL